MIERDGYVKGIEEIWNTRNGRIIYVRENARVVRDENGKVLYYEGTVEDITERKIAEEQLLSSEKKFRELFEYANTSVFIFEPNNEIVLEVNNKACTTYGFDRDEFIGMSFKKITKNVQRGEQYVTQLLKDECYRDFETTHFRKDGSEIDLLVSSTVIDYNGGTAILSINWDITEQQKIKTELIKAKEKAEEMNRLKTNFLANMSHELRTPLIGILGYADIIAAEADNPELKEMAEIVKNSGKRLNETLNAILDISRIESEQIEKNFEEINLNDFLTECKNDFEDAARNKGLWLNILMDKDPINVFLDKSLLNKITNNIMSNAIKYADKGGVLIKANYNKDLNKVNFSFIDTGVGISREHLDLIFDPFRQVSEGLNREFEGTGLGLTVTKKLVELLGGTISVESQLGKGSTFNLELPCNGKEHKSDEEPVSSVHIISSEKLPKLTEDTTSVKILKFIYYSPNMSIQMV
jgi:PAS domain S-box-containing protein